MPTSSVIEAKGVQPASVQLAVFGVQSVSSVFPKVPVVPDELMSDLDIASKKRNMACKQLSL